MEVPVICAPLRRPVVPPELTSCLGDLQFVGDYSTVDDIKVDILIGLDAYWKFVKPNIITVPDSLLAAQSTVFGWMLYDSVPGGQDFSDSVVAHQLLCVDVLDKNINAFWELKSIGIPSPCYEKLRDPVLEKFQENLRMVDDRYEVTLPWKPGTQDKLHNNEKLARVRLQQLGKRLNRDPGLKDRYDATIREMWDKMLLLNRSRSLSSIFPILSFTCHIGLWYEKLLWQPRSDQFSTHLPRVTMASLWTIVWKSVHACWGIWRRFCFGSVAGSLPSLQILRKLFSR